MIGMKRYYEEIGKVFIDTIIDTSPENKSPSKEVLTMLFEKIEQLNQKELEEGELEFNYIFMRNTKIYNWGQGIPSTGTTYWIGKIESVDGFFLGMV